MVSRGLARLERSRAGAFRRAIAESVRAADPHGRGSAASASGCARRPAGGRSPTTCCSCRCASSATCSSPRRGADRWRWLCCPPTSTTLPGDSAKFYFFEIDATDPAPLAGAVVGARRPRVRRPVGHDRRRVRPVGARRPAARPDGRRAARRPGHRPADAPDGGRRQGRGRAAAHRARPPRRCPATPRRPRRQRSARRARSSTDDPEAGTASWWPTPTRRPRRR